jgi:DeoR family transcriptional regulator of aga operon
MLEFGKVTSQRSFIPAQRHTLILNILEQKGTVSIIDLASLIGVSDSTIRRDLNHLAKNSKIKRSFGGATLSSPHSTTFEPAYEIGSKANHLHKVAIGRLAVERIDDGLSVLFDSSSTVHQVAHHVVNQKLKITAITNDLNIALTLGRSPHVQLLVPGGTLRPGRFTLLGEPGLTFLKSIHADLTFIGVHGIFDEKLGDTSIDVITTKRQLIASARKAIVVADATKFDLSTFCDICHISEVSEVITDSRIGEQQKKNLEKLNVSLSVASSNELSPMIVKDS